MNKSPLIIGDYAAVRRLIREVLRTNFATTLRGGYGMEGVPLAEREKPTIILLDLDTAMSAGLQTSRLLGARSGLRQVPILIVTARSSPADMVGGATDGGRLFVLKSFRATQLRAGVRTSSLRAPAQQWCRL
jgi:DNA-binding response OmpR family regulator